MIMISVREQAAAAKAAAVIYQEQPAALRRQLLESLAQALVDCASELLAENAAEVQEQVELGLMPVLLDRLRLTSERIRDMVLGVRQIAAQADLLGTQLERRHLPSGLQVKKVQVPLGVVGIIYEARPNVTVDAAALCLKTGNAVLLRGSRLATKTNRCLVRIVTQVLDQHRLPLDLVQMIADSRRESVLELARLRGLVDVIIPRGGAQLIQTVVEHAMVPVLETGIGNCHLFIDQSAPLEMALDIALNGKCSRPAVCNSLEKVLIHRNWPQTQAMQLIQALQQAGVLLHLDQELHQLVPDAALATAEDWDREYLALELGIRQVDSLEQAIAHINRHGSRHSEAIVTLDESAADLFLRQVDAACVYHNASTRFSDGFALGLGAEIGISTQKLHARGPMGQEALTSYKYVIIGNGQVR